MIFNGVNFEDYVVVENIRRRFLPPLTPTGTAVPGRIGHLYKRTSIEPAPIEVDIRIIEETREEAQDKADIVAGLLVTDTPKRLELRDRPGKHNYAILEGDMSYEKFLNTGFVTLTFICYDPISYSNDIFEYTNISGVNLMNNGTAPIKNATIEVEMTENKESLMITLNNTNEKIFIEETLVQGDIVVVNLFEEYVKVNDIFTKVHLDSDYFKIPVGEYKITSSSGIMGIKYREGWY